MRFVCVCVCVLLCKTVKKKATYYYKEVISSMIMEVLFYRTSLLASLCAWCAVCFLKQMREKCHITLKTTYRLLRFALGVCSLLCKAIKKKAPYYCKEDKSSMLIEWLFSRTFFLLAALCDWCVVCILKQTRDKCHITVKATHRLLSI